MDIDKMMELANDVNGRARTRLLGRDSAEMLLRLIEEKAPAPEVTTIRVYATNAWVAGSYRGVARARFFEARRNAEGGFDIVAADVDGHRSYGISARVTVNGRAYTYNG